MLLRGYIYHIIKTLLKNILNYSRLVVLIKFFYLKNLKEQSQYIILLKNF